jgi:hypothetical protein
VIIIKNYIDLGFGNPSVDFSNSLYSSIENKQMTNHGFGSQDLNFENNKYINQKDFNFGSKGLNIFKKDIEYIFDEISESGFVTVEPESFSDIKIKNKLIFSPNISYSIKNNVHRIDYSIWIEKVNSKNFKIHNFSSKELEISYIANSTLIKKNILSINQNRIDRLNFKIKNSLKDILVETPKYTTSRNEEDIAIFSASPGAEPNDNIQYNVHNRFVEYNIAGLFDITNLPVNTYFSIETPDVIPSLISVAAMFNQLVYEVTDSNDLSTRTIRTLSSPVGNWTYGIHLLPSTIYHFWLENDNNWYYNTSSFPSVIEYI